MDFDFRTSYYVDANTPNPTALFEAARTKCFNYMKSHMDFEATYRIKLDIITTDFADTDGAFQVKTLKVTARVVSS
jgi:hypothetical protein